MQRPPAPPTAPRRRGRCVPPIAVEPLGVRQHPLLELYHGCAPLAALRPAWLALLALLGGGLLLGRLLSWGGLLLGRSPHAEGGAGRVDEDGDCAHLADLHPVEHHVGAGFARTRERDLDV